MCLLLALLINILKVFYPLTFQCCFALQVETDFLFPTLPVMNRVTARASISPSRIPELYYFLAISHLIPIRNWHPQLSRTQQVKHFYILVITFPCANFQILKLVQSVVTEGCS